MQLEVARFIISEAGRAALAELAVRPAGLQPANHLATLSRLRPDFGPETAAGLLEVAVARQRAAATGKFSRAAAMFFTKAALEQASGETIAAYRAGRFARALPHSAQVADLGCGVGGDSLELARYCRVTGVDLDPARLLLAQANAAVYGVQDHFQVHQADITRFDPAGFDALFFDPARRQAERRLFSVEDYSPPLSIIRQWLPHTPNLAVKISPGVQYEELRGYDCEIEIISEAGAVKEAVLWFGALRSVGPDGHPVTRRATLLPDALSLTRRPDQPAVPVSPPQAYLYEPDGAVIRAGLVEELAQAIGAVKIDPEIAYLTSARPVTTPYARLFRVIEWLPFSLKKLRRRLQELGAGRVTVKKRGSPLDPQELEQALEQALKLSGAAEAEFIVILTHVEGAHTAIICRAERQLDNELLRSQQPD